MNARESYNDIISLMKFPTLILLFIQTSCIYGQRQIIYDLDSYKQVVFERSELTISPSGRLEGSDLVNVEGGDANTNLNIGANILHEKFLNDKSKQYYMRQSGSVDISKGSFIKADRTTEKRAYVNNRYLKTGYTANLIYDNRINPINGGKRNEGFGGLRLDLGIGFGRIENVNSAWIAVQILQGLEDNNLLLRIPTHDEITAFADLLGLVRTSRILDFRLRDIAILEFIIDYLIENELIDQLSTMAILIIEDTFEFDIVANRNNGSRFEMTFQPFSRYRKNAPNNPISAELNNGATGIMEHLKYKNIDSKWMRTIRYSGIIDVAYNKNFIDENLILNNDDNSVVTARMEYDLSWMYIPSARNNFSFGIDSEVEMNAIFSKNQPDQFSAARLLLNITSVYNHYFTPATQLRVIFQLGYRDSEFQAGKYQPFINSYIDFGITHAIF
jgi:hypothetical protein